MSDTVWFWATVIKLEARKLWNSLPGPWWVKVALVVITQAIPGPQDELLLMAVVAGARTVKARRAAR